MRILRPVVLPSTGKAIDFKPGALLESVSGELGLRKYLESNGHTLIVTSHKDGPNSVLERERCRDRYLAAFLAGIPHGGVSEQYVDQLLNLTTIPRLTRCASSLASQFVMRTQPCEAFLSIFEGSGVPCRP
jgi:hypothetical protein